MHSSTIKTVNQDDQLLIIFQDSFLHNYSIYTIMRMQKAEDRKLF